MLQLALDLLDLDRALRIAADSVKGGADWLECGTPLIKSEGLNAVREMKAAFPAQRIVADMKVMDAGRTEVEAAAKAGASVIGVLGAASDETIRECCEAAANVGAEIVVDMINVSDVPARAKRAEELGAHLIGIHTPIDVQMAGGKPFAELKAVRDATQLPIVVAGGINSETAAEAVKAGASVVIVGGAITHADDVTAATAAVKRAMETGQAVASEHFKRVGPEGLCELLSAISTANLSDALHRGGCLEGIRPVFPETRLCGPAMTVRTYPGDWAKPVQAIDKAEPGDVLVIDVGGVGPAVWGELATYSAMQKGLAGVVIDGAIRDTDEIRETGFAAYSRLIMPNAGEPKGFGEIGVPVTVGGQRVSSGDWILGDNDGIAVLPAAKAVEYANRAKAVLEQEMRLRREIEDGSTLGEVAHLLKWEKKT